MSYWAQLKVKQEQLVTLAYALGCEPECGISREYDQAPTLEILDLSSQLNVLWPEWESEVDKAIEYLEGYKRG